MAFVDNAVLAANKAVNRIGALANQAKSYYSNPAMLKARSVASGLANTAWVKGKAMATSRGAMVGVLGGAAGGVGYSYMDNENGGIRDRMTAGIKGGLLGGLAGAGYSGVRAAGGPRAIMRNMSGKMGSYGSRAGSAFTARVAMARNNIAMSPTMRAMTHGGYSS